MAALERHYIVDNDTDVDDIVAPEIGVFKKKYKYTDV